MSHRILISQLHAVAADRPPGYLQAVLDAATENGVPKDGVLVLSDQAYARLCKRYRAITAPIRPQAINRRPPSLAKKARNAFGAVGSLTKAAVKREKIKVSKEEKDRRVAICDGTAPGLTKPCEFFTRSINFGAISCAKCSCALNLKTRLETESCPIGKW